MSDVAAAIRAKLDSMVEDPGKSYVSCAGCEGDCNCQAWMDYQAALLAVLELHTSFTIEGGEFQGLEVCNSCGDTTDEILSVNWPCPTLLAIAKALGIEEA